MSVLSGRALFGKVEPSPSGAAAVGDDGCFAALIKSGYTSRPACSISPQETRRFVSTKPRRLALIVVGQTLAGHIHAALHTATGVLDFLIEPPRQASVRRCSRPRKPALVLACGRAGLCGHRRLMVRRASDLGITQNILGGFSVATLASAASIPLSRPSRAFQRLRSIPA